MAKATQQAINEGVAAALAAMGIKLPEGGALAAAAPTTTAQETKEQKEARKLRVAASLPATLDVAGQSAPLTFTASKKGKEFTIHSVVAGVKVRINGYVMPE